LTENYTLLERQGTICKLKVTTSQTAEKQSLKHPGLPPAAKTTLTKLTAKGAGEIQIDLVDLVPLKSKLDLTTETEMLIDFVGQKQTMAMKNASVIEIERGDAKPKKPAEPAAGSK
ncbi:MAG: hypothetical protein AAF517_13025, partial [Planctomycetota bacterium]